MLMKTYTHKNGMKAEMTPQLNTEKLYHVKIDKWVIWYNLFQFPVTEQELLDFWFIEDKQEDWIDKAYDHSTSFLEYTIPISYKKRFRESIGKYLPK